VDATRRRPREEEGQRKDKTYRKWVKSKSGSPIVQQKKQGETVKTGEDKGGKRLTGLVSN